MFSPMITKKDFEEFEKDYLFQVIKNPTYRYGQAFINYFRDEVSMTYNQLDDKPSSSWELWEERDVTRAREMCLTWVEQ